MTLYCCRTCLVAVLFFFSTGLSDIGALTVVEPGTCRPDQNFTFHSAGQGSELFTIDDFAEDISIFVFVGDENEVLLQSHSLLSQAGSSATERVLVD
jgi:hypothetical protein